MKTRKGLEHLITGMIISTMGVESQTRANDLANKLIDLLIEEKNLLLTDDVDLIKWNNIWANWGVYCRTSERATSLGNSAQFYKWLSEFYELPQLKPIETIS